MGLSSHGRHLLLLRATIGLLLLIPTIEASTCLMLYMVADNDHDYYLRRDYDELVNSAAIKGDTLRPWIYYDGWDQGMGEPLPHTVGSDGNPLAMLFTGSRIMTFDAALQKMRVDVEYPTERDSDMSSTLQEFLEHALSDCLADGYDSLFIGFLGYGHFGGFGGDQNGRRRHLLQANKDIAGAIRKALSAVEGPGRVDVIGFDASLMQDIGVGADYLNVSKNILASESVVPGHGWRFANLTARGDAVTFAGHILQTYLNEGPPFGGAHESPKTMSLIDTDKYATFLEIWESFCEALLYWLQQDDASLHAFVSRARQSAVTFNGAADATAGAFYPSSVDIGSFLRQFLILCNPTGSNLIVFLDITKDVYNEMFVTRGYGPGTTPGTGMKVTWPNQGDYARNKDFWDELLFEDDIAVTRHTPHFRQVLEWFLTSSPPGGGHEGSVCNNRAVAKNETGSDRLVMMNQGGKDDATGILNILRTEVSSNVSQIEVQYGLDVSTLFAKKLLLEAGYVQQEDEYWHLLGGDVVGRYSQTTFSASWDKNFYFLNVSGTFNRVLDPVYVFDRKDGAKQINVLYFPQERRNELFFLKLEDYLNFDMKVWEETLDAQFGFLTFSVNPMGEVNNNHSLFTSQDGIFAEQPLADGGYIVPLTYADAYWQGKKISVLPGGLHQKIYNWSPDLDCQIARIPVEQVVDWVPGMDTVVMNLYANSYGSKSIASEVHYLDAIKPDDVGREVVVGAVILEDDASGNSTSSSSDEIPASPSEDTNFGSSWEDMEVTIDIDIPAAAANETAIPETTNLPTTSPSAVLGYDASSEEPTIFVAEGTVFPSRSSRRQMSLGLSTSVVLLAYACWPT